MQRGKGPRGTAEILGSRQCSDAAGQPAMHVCHAEGGCCTEGEGERSRGKRGVKDKERLIKE